MDIFTESKLIFSEKTKSYAWTAAQVLLGSLFLAACAQIAIPLYPIPLTMQTFGIFLLAAMQGGKKASFSALIYLGLATLGLPVLSAGTANSLWFAFPTVGYLVAFPIVSYIIGKMVHLKEKPTALWIMMSVLVGQIVLYCLGVAGLTHFLSFKQSILVGVVPFLPLAAVKIVLAASLGGAWLRWKK